MTLRWLTLTVSVILVCTPLSAQSGSAQLSARFGIASDDDSYQSNCGHSSLALGLDVQGRRRFFPQLSLDYLTGSGGGDVACLPIPGTTTEGGLRLEGSARASVGAGARVGNRFAQLEGAALAGLVSGRPGFTAELGTLAEQGDRRLLPHVGVQGSLVLFRYVVLTSTTTWTRLSFDVTPTATGVTTNSENWSPMWTWQVGVRMPVR